MKHPKTLLVVFSSIFLLAACSSPSKLVSTPRQELVVNSFSTIEASTNTTPTVNGKNVPEITSTKTTSPALAEGLQPGLTRSDGQGAVTVEIKPLNLNNQDEDLKFEVVLDTHSVELSMDLVVLTTLTTDKGESVQAMQWDGPRGGHHVEGILSFPRLADENNLLDSARSITITIKDVDVPLRTFTWQIQE